RRTMGDLFVALRVSGSLAARVAAGGLDALGHAVVARFAALNVWTAALLAGALVVDRLVARHTRAAWRLALYAPIALRVLPPIDWTLQLAAAPRADALLVPLVVHARDGDAASPHAVWLHGAIAALYLAVAAFLASRAIVARVRLARSLDG